MSYNGEIAIDLDSHTVERADRFSDASQSGGAVAGA